MTARNMPGILTVAAVALVAGCSGGRGGASAATVNKCAVGVADEIQTDDAAFSSDLTRDGAAIPGLVKLEMQQQSQRGMAADNHYCAQLSDGQLAQVHNRLDHAWSVLINGETAVLP